MTVPADWRATGACDECGAASPAGLTCRTMFEALLGWESEDPALRAEHFLTVATYNLQHPAGFTAEAVAGLQAVFVAHLDHAIPVAELRRRVGRAAAGARRVRRHAAESRPVPRSWAATVADVYAGGDPAGAAERVRAWARAVRRQL